MTKKFEAYLRPADHVIPKEPDAPATPDTSDTEDETLLDVLKDIRDSLDNINDTLGSHPDMTWHTKATVDSVLHDRELLRNLFKKDGDK